MKRFISLLSIVIFMVPGSLLAQIDGGAFNSTGSGYSVVSLSDYQSLGVNPANLGWTKDGHTFHLGLMEFGTSVYSEPLTKKMVFNDLIGNSEDFSSEAQRDEAIRNFTDTELLIRISNTLFGFSYQDEKIGGFAFSVKQKITWRSKLNQQASEFLFEGYNSPYFDSIVEQNGEVTGYATNPEIASRVYNPTDISHLFYNEYILGYGKKLLERNNVRLFAGIDIKLLQGYGILNYNSLTFTHVEGYQALSPFYDVNYDEPTPSRMQGGGLKTAGMGYGVDIGLSVEIFNKARFALALNDLGSIRWDGNVYQGENVPVWSIETPGIDNYDIFTESEGIIVENDHLGKWVGLQDKRVKLPMHTRLGADYLAMKKLRVGIEVLIPIEKEVPGAFSEEYYAAGVQYTPKTWFTLSGGFTYGGGFGFKMPVGFTFRPVNNENRLWEMGIASRDIITWIKTEDPMVSIVFGFLRFGFGN